jgi:hypothetical protein
VALRLDLNLPDAFLGVSAEGKALGDDRQRDEREQRRQPEHHDDGSDRPRRPAAGRGGAEYQLPRGSLEFRALLGDHVKPKQCVSALARLAAGKCVDLSLRVGKDTSHIPAELCVAGVEDAPGPSIVSEFG